MERIPALELLTVLSGYEIKYGDAVRELHAVDDAVCLADPEALVHDSGVECSVKEQVTVEIAVFRRIAAVGKVHSS